MIMTFVRLFANYMEQAKNRLSYDFCQAICKLHGASEERIITTFVRLFSIANYIEQAKNGSSSRLSSYLQTTWIKRRTDHDDCCQAIFNCKLHGTSEERIIMTLVRLFANYMQQAKNGSS